MNGQMKGEERQYLMNDMMKKMKERDRNKA